VGVLLATFLVSAVLLGQDFADMGPTGAERTLFFGLVAIALTCGLLSELAIIYWRFRPRGRGTAVFLLGGGLANAVGAIIPAVVAYYVLASDVLDGAPGLVVAGLACAWMLLATWFVSSRLVTWLSRTVAETHRSSAAFAVVAASIVSAPISWWALVALYGAPRPGRAIEESVARPASVRALYAQFPVDALAIVEPIEFIDSETPICGRGAPSITTLTGQDARGQVFCVKRIVGPSSEEESYYFQLGSCEPGTQALIAGGSVEAALYGLLLRWEAAHPESAVASERMDRNDDVRRRRASQIAYRVLGRLNERVLG
jgi:hypothetical protein